MWRALIVLTVAIGVLAGCTKPTKISDFYSAEDEVMAESFWIAVDAAGLDRSIQFEDAKYLLGDVLLAEWNTKLGQIQSYGIRPFWTMPYCTGAVSGAAHITALQSAVTPVEAARHTNFLIELIHGMSADVLAARRGAGKVSSKECRGIEMDIREALGLPPLEVLETLALGE